MDFLTGLGWVEFKDCDTYWEADVGLDVFRWLQDTPSSSTKTQSTK